MQQRGTNCDERGFRKARQTYRGLEQKPKDAAEGCNSRPSVSARCLSVSAAGCEWRERPGAALISRSLGWPIKPSSHLFADTVNEPLPSMLTPPLSQ